MKRFTLRAMVRCTRFWQESKGVSAVEFALIVPIMITLFLGAVEFGHALTIDRRVTAIASATGDLAAQVEEVDDGAVQDIFEASSEIIKPYTEGPLSIVLTNVEADADGNTTVTWSETRNGAARATGSAISVPSGLVQPSQCVILAEVTYSYSPPVGHFLTGGITMTESFYLKPRRSVCVTKT